ncbi:Cysteine-rich receptor-like protein kinase 25 [Acorus calamus]|uniref:Cysteine-rich receptor-like protein kinase 25 n=1 Tax=Acorus calamus TaxID=4465 RepID=A0AAV9DU11_ACOCL|nr:Cysteine-rich receptor-like protein kinase 25 [Acorus calamus]
MIRGLLVLREFIDKDGFHSKEEKEEQANNSSPDHHPCDPFSSNHLRSFRLPAKEDDYYEECTNGYMAPEYALRGLFSIKSDVISFGVLVLEIITGWRSNQFYAPDNTIDLLSYVWKFWVEGRALELISPSMGDLSRGKAMRCMHITLLCVQEDAMDRPNMSSVVLMVSSHSTSLTVPSRPAFYVGDSRERLPDIENTTPDRSIATTESKSASVNDVSITELEPR